MDCCLLKGLVTSFVGGGSPGGTTSGAVDGMGSYAQFGTIYGLVVDVHGLLFAADASYNKIRQVTPLGTYVMFMHTLRCLFLRD